jgi:hypothetical protein
MSLKSHASKMDKGLARFAVSRANVETKNDDMPRIAKIAKWERLKARLQKSIGHSEKAN